LSKYPNSPELVLRLQAYRDQCLSIFRDANLTPQRQREEVLKTFLIIFQAKPNSDLTRPRPLLVQITPIDQPKGEFSITIKKKEAWLRQWFRRAPDGSPLTDPEHYHVIVGSPCGEDAAEQTLRTFNRKYPDVHFELWQTVGNCYVAVTVGIGLDQGSAK